VQDNQSRFRDPTTAEIRRLFAKKASEAYPIALARLKRQRVPEGTAEPFSGGTGAPLLSEIKNAIAW
jgi:hypothetical protein